MKWELKITHSYHEMRFRFRKITEAEAFLNAFMEAKQPDTDPDDKKYEWKYSIHPILNEEKNNDGNDE